jgi:transcriptional regulator with GAF, ATPase, and Fis domain
MRMPPLHFYKAIFEDLDPEKLQKNFLGLLLGIQNVDRGSIWVKADEGYLCLEASGEESHQVRGVVLPFDRPSVVGWVIENGEMTVAEAHKDPRHHREIESTMARKSSRILCFPLILTNGSVYGAVEVMDTAEQREKLRLDREYLKLLQHIVDICSIALSNALSFTDKLNENIRLRQALKDLRSQDKIIGQSSNFLQVISMVKNYASTDFPVLITGESGTGKDLIATEMHRQSARREKAFLVQNCSAIPDTLLESELFGYKKGAFTGADRNKVGLFEAAHQGTVFLDEIGDMPLNLQARILRVLQNQEVKPLGATTSRKVDVRLIAATNKDLKQAIGQGKFREDLFYRLNVLPLHVPPLRERTEDIPLMLEHFLYGEAQKMGLKPKMVSSTALQKLLEYPWKGNVRELENFAKYILAAVPGSTIYVRDLPEHIKTPVADPNQEQPHPKPQPIEPVGLEDPSLFSFADFSWEELDRAYISFLLEKNKWNVTRSAHDAGIKRSTFDSRMKKLGIRR